jgi:glycosyltransferase involved in cell wall biosynthesis
MKRILVLANNLAQASFRLRIAALIAPLAERGFELDVQLRPKGLLAGPKLWPILKTAGEYDAVLLQRKFLGPLDASLLRKNAKRILYDIDDALMFHNRPVGRVSRWRTQRRFLATARIVDHVAAGNEYLADLLRRQGCRATVIPTVIDATRYEAKSHGPTSTPRLVWIGSHSTLPYLQTFLPAIEQAARDVPGLRLLTIADVALKSDRIAVEHEPWSEAGEAAALCRGDIGIAPTPADPWTMGKCGFKVLQYMAAGLPVIASPVGANAQIVVDGQTGLLPAQPQDWPSAIARLAKDPELRSRMGFAAHQRVQTEYSLERAADLWAALLETPEASDSKSPVPTVE